MSHSVAPKLVSATRPVDYLRHSLLRQLDAYLTVAKGIRKTRFTKFYKSEEESAFEEFIRAVEESGGIGLNFSTEKTENGESSGDNLHLTGELRQDAENILSELSKYFAIFEEVVSLRRKYQNTPTPDLVTIDDFRHLRSNMLNLQLTVKELYLVAVENPRAKVPDFSAKFTAESVRGEFRVDRPEFEMSVNRHSVYFYALYRWCRFLENLSNAAAIGK